MEIKNTVNILALLVFLTTFFNCKSDRQNKKVKNGYTVQKEIKIDSSKQYFELIKVFEDHRYDMPEDLWTYKDFIYFYENSNHYVNEAIRILESQKTNKTQQEVIIYSMQRLSLDKYMELYKSLHNLYKKGIIEKEVFFTVLYPSFGKQNTIIRNYKDDLIQANIKELLSDSTLKDYHTSFNNILNGKAWRDIKEYSGM